VRFSDSGHLRYLTLHGWRLGHVRGIIAGIWIEECIGPEHGRETLLLDRYLDGESGSGQPTACLSLG